jgi:hypothetical protein
MSKQSTLATFAAITVLGLSTQAIAATVDEIKYDNEVKSCVAEIQGYVNYDDASRVRHDVVLVKRKLVGYAMKIETSIYTESADDATREYATFCVVNGNHKPMKFEISEIDAGA